MKDEDADRKSAVQRVADHLERRGGARFLMFWIVAATALAGFFASVGLLRIGMVSMWLRYALSVALAYAVFLFQIWLWVRHRRGVKVDERIRADLQRDDVPDRLAHDRTRRSSHFDVPSPSGGSGGGGGGGVDLDLGELVAIIVFVAAVALACVAALYVVYAAPSLLAEVLLDGVLSAGLYRRFRRVERREWLLSVWMGTRVPVIVTALFFIVAGAVGQLYAPEAVSIGGVWRHSTSTRGHDGKQP